MKNKAERRYKQMEGKIATLIAVLMLTSIFAFSFALADSSGNSTENQTLEIPQAPSNDDIGSVLNESNQTPDGYKLLGSSNITYSQGWALSGSNGYLVNALWAISTFAKISNTDIKNIRDNFKNDSAGRQAALREAANESFAEFSNGRIVLGTGKGQEILGLKMSNSSTGANLVFDVMSNQKGNNAGVIIGSLTLNSQDYSNVTVYTGTLVLNSGNYVGTYTLNMAGKTSEVNSVVGNKKGEVQKQLNNQDNSKSNGFLGFFKNLFNKAKPKSK